MTTVYLNGEYLPADRAMVSVEDRGFLLADGVYEVLRVYDGKPFEIDRHLRRLRDSLAAIRLDCDPAPLADITMQLLERNGLTDAKAYWQITRGPAPRNHAFPDSPRPTVYARLDAAEPLEAPDDVHAASVILYPDRRWLECGIKSLMLLPNALARQAAAEAGCIEAILHRGSVVTEGAATSVFAVIDGVLRTHPADGSILPGVTRAVVVELARKLDIPVRENAFTLDDLPGADELILTGTTRHVTAITRCGDHAYPVGEATRKLHAAFVEKVSGETRN